MKKKIFVAVITLFVIADLILGYSVFIKKEPKTNKFSNDLYSFEYKKGYGIKENDGKVSLTNGNNSGQIDIVVQDYKDENKSAEEVSQIYSKAFQEKNSKYSLDYSGYYNIENTKVYNFLYVNKDELTQTDINFIIKNDKVYEITYSNTDTYFDYYEKDVIDLLKTFKIN